MQGALMFLDLMVVVLSFAATTMLVSVVLRTEKELDKAMKAYLIAIIIIVIASVIQLNKYYLFVPPEKLTVLFQLSRVTSIYFFCVGSYAMLRIVNKEHK